MEKAIVDIHYQEIYAGEKVPKHIKLVGLRGYVGGHTTFVVPNETFDDLIVEMRRLGIDVDVTFKQYDCD